MGYALFKLWRFFEMKKKAVSLLAIITIIANLIALPVQAACTPTNEAYTLVNYLNNKVGESFASNRCQAFVYQSVGNAIGVWASKACAYEAWQAWGVSSSKDIPLGATVYFSGSSVQCGNHKAGHVGIYVGDGYIIHAASSKVQKTQISYIENYWSGYNYLGWGWNGGHSLATATPATPPDTEAPSNPNNLTSQKSVYTSSEDIFLTWDAALGATNYWIYMWKDGEQIYYLKLGNVTEFHSLPTSAGKYTFIVRSENSYGCSDGVAYNFVVTDDIPEKVTNIHTNKSEYTTGEEITFYWNQAYGTQEYWVYLWKDGTQIDYCNVGLKTNYTTSLLGSGQYTFIVRPGNINGYNEGSESYSFEVKKPPFEINSNRGVYKSSESIDFTWNLVDGATDYWVYMWKDGVELYSVNMGNNTGFTSAPTSSGKYTIIVRAIGNNSSYADYSFDFIVTDDVPASATNIRSHKTVYIPHDNITFEWNQAYGAQEYLVYLWKDGTQIDYCNVGLKTNYTTSLLGSGQYTFIVRPGNINGYNEGSEWYTFDVGLYSVEYYANNTFEIFDRQTKKHESALVISNKIPKREGYTFLGWNTKEDGSGIYYGSESLYTSNESVKLYAQWKKLIPYTDSIVTKNGSSCYVNVVPVNIEESCEVIVAAYKGGKFVTLTKVPYESEEINTTLSGDIDEIKVMVWNSLSGLKPLCEAEVIPSSEFIIE